MHKNKRKQYKVIKEKSSRVTLSITPTEDAYIIPNRIKTHLSSTSHATITERAKRSTKPSTSTEKKTEEKSSFNPRRPCRVNPPCEIPSHSHKGRSGGV